MTTGLQGSIAAVTPKLQVADVSAEDAVHELLTATLARRTLDLSDLTPAEQAELVAARALGVIPSVAVLATRLAGLRASGDPVVVKLGIDPTSTDVHLGHVVPVLMLSRFQRMGYTAVLIIGDFTAKIGDPSGRSTERPTLTDAVIEANLATYRDQIAPFFDFDRAQLRRNGDWLSQIRLSELLGVLARIPVSQALQRDDFRQRLSAGSGLAMSEFLYSVVMALDSVEIAATVELGGVDQLLNLQMGRTVMEIHGQPPQLVVTLPLIEGIDGTGKKMSKSLGNYIALSDPPADVFGKVMSIPDRLTVPYLRAWTEWDDAEIAVVEARVVDHSVHPMDLKKLLAGEVVAVLTDVDTAMAARRDWTAQFSTRTIGDVETLPTLSIAEHGSERLGAVLTELLGWARGTAAVRRQAEQGGLQLLISGDARKLAATSVYETLADVEARERGDSAGEIFLKFGRKVARLTP